MNKRVFKIDEKCYLIYTGLSSADNISFLRIGNSKFITENIQKHIRFIAINDVSNINIKLEKENIKDMENGKIRYICNDKNRELLFQKLTENGINTQNLYIKELSKDLDNISKIENKKHFFTIFYDDKNIKVVSDEEFIFDYFESNKENVDYKKERDRLNNFIEEIDRLNTFYKTKNSIKKNIESISLNYEKSTLFIIQNENYFPFTIGMFKSSIENNILSIDFTTSLRFWVGKDVELILLENDIDKIRLYGVIQQGEIIESGILYKYIANFSATREEEIGTIINFYKNLFKRSG